jgi:hypothetical protein
MPVGVTIPTNYNVSGPGNGPIPTEISGSLGAIGPVTVAGIPSTFDINIDKLPDIHIDIDKLPKILLGIDPLEIKPLDLNLSIKQFPNIRGHVPADFCVGLSIMGMELLSLRLCGEAQVITEPYVPNPCERCGDASLTPVTHGTTVGRG